MFLKLYQIKQHLNIDEDFHEDDEYLCQLGETVQYTIEKHIDCSLSELAKENGGELPPPLLHASLLLLAQFYNNRENVAFVKAQEIPTSYSYLLDLFKNYSNSNLK